MVEFASDGSIMLPKKMAQKKETEAKRFNDQRCIKVRREIVSDFSPKKCALHIEVSPRIVNPEFVPRIFSYFEREAEVPLKLIRKAHNAFEIEVGTCFRRCSECNSLISRFRSALDGNVLENKGNCTFKQRDFCYEDYFD